ncbi:MAG: YoaK family protein [Pseudomonadota bacterium]|nr:YoaK family protein [Pseudomonadota bacterium]
MSFVRTLTHDRRTARANTLLGVILAFVAGAANAGGFLAVGQYTSHMTGMVSSIADHLVLGQVGLAVGAALSVLMFLAGAVTTSMIVSFCERRHLHSRYALPLLLESVLLLLFGVLGPKVHLSMFALPATVALLCFIMGLQNAVITKISNAVIRTTHITGLLTDLGIELGKVLYLNRTLEEPRVRADLERLQLHATLIIAFGTGGGFGALGFKAVGFSITSVLAVALLAVCWRPVLDDVRLWRRFATRPRPGAAPLDSTPATAATAATTVTTAPTRATAAHAATTTAAHAATTSATTSATK